ncbi:MAG TPA: YkgJ family cysteine cluster protein [Gemmataceae bacterium]|nr:YkgJ family cysteine cluster protein [Gemmataceae bacterium]
MADPWYADGLAFTCTRCGNCCRGAPGAVWVNDDELRAIAKYRGENALEVEKLYTRMIQGSRSLRERTNGDCVFWDQEAGCTVYPVRPRQCRTWPFWASNVHTPETWEQVTKVCPGAGKGDLIPVEEITWRLNVIRI